ncbi:MAG: Gfo/Idh/MocA family oxidoreductase, partial [Clostridia bacterium]|nr:Gfo/Idh/MocA family oxidoreductase [Clostridia bacterium]
MNIGIIGAGNIAKKMANTVNCLEEFCNYAVASRDIEKAKAFKLEFGFKKVYGNYEELLQDDNVELVYVATVHSTHYDIMKLCLKYNKPVICEKCFTTSLNDTIGIYRNFEDKKLFVTEALWTSYMPSRQIIDALLKDNVVGKNIVMHAQFRLPISQVERLKRKDLGGGSMMDLGIYPVSFVFRTLGFNYASCFVSD